MGCCGASKYDFDLENSKNISDLINVMKKKIKKFNERKRRNKRTFRRSK